MSAAPGLVAAAREHIASRMDDLEGENDFMPFMLVNGPTSSVYAALDMPDWGTPRDPVADLMTAMLLIHRATEAVFTSTAWTLQGLSEEERKQWGNRSFEEHPDRKETVFTLYAGPDGDRFYTAPVIRENNKVTLGDWVGGDEHFDDGQYRMGGRFGNAMHHGIAMARELPPDMVEFIDAAMARGEERELMTQLLRTLRRIRARGEH